MPVIQHKQATVFIAQIDHRSNLSVGTVTGVIWALGQTAVSIAHGYRTMPCQTRVPNQSWQMFLPIEIDGLREALLLQATAIAVAGPELLLRLCVGNGDAEFIAAGEISSASGSAFVSSGRLLDAKKDRRIDHADPFLSRGAFRKADKITAEWNTTQAKVMQVVLDPNIKDIGQAAEYLGWDVKILRNELKLAKFEQIKDMVGLGDFDRAANREMAT